MKTLFLRLGVTLMIIALPMLASAQTYSENFDSYSAGSGLMGQGGWAGWGCGSAGEAFVTGQFSNSPPNSVDITPTTDIVQEFSGVTSGMWEISAMCYVPSGGSGETYFILLNTYVCPTTFNWSLDLLFDQSAGMVSSVEGSATTPIINDQWVEVKVEFNLGTDTQTLYYNGAFFDTIPWAGVGGVAELAALDLFSNGGSSIYWDDICLRQAGDPPCGGATPVEPSSWGQIKSIYK